MNNMRACGVILDLDGVITRTADVHARAWKAAFDSFLEAWGKRHGCRPVPFDLRRDYLRHVDGKPRLDGVRDFLASRQITVPEGSESDSAAEWTVHGIGKAKNDRFRESIEAEGVQLYDSTLELIDALRQKGIPQAVVSSSKNCRFILERCALINRFEAVVDGNDVERLGLAGKPSPDLFSEAARRLRCAPADIVMVEDAASGVEAGRRGGFGRVVGVDRGGNRDLLYQHGADRVVGDLGEVALDELLDLDREGVWMRDALEYFDAISTCLEDRPPVLFFDYDGTLTPIVDDPKAAELAPSTRERLERLAALWPVAVISGRDLPDIQRRVAIDNLFYAGSHGFDIQGPKLRLEQPQAQEYLPALDRAEQSLRQAIGSVPGLLLERKRFSLAVHYRRVPARERTAVGEAVAAIAERCGLRRSGGKMVYELQPPVAWDKGRALYWLLEALEIDAGAVTPVYLGDDLTDEDAFKALPEHGIGILVGRHGAPSAAGFRLDGPAAVARFFDRLLGNGPLRKQERLP